MLIKHLNTNELDIKKYSNKNITYYDKNNTKNIRSTNKIDIKLKNDDDNTLLISNL